MVKRGEVRAWLARWWDQWKLALKGVLLATKKPRFVIGAGLGFVIFGTLLNLLASGTAAFALLRVSDWGGKLKIMGDAFLNLFGVGRNFWDWALIFGIALLQAVLVGLMVLVWDWRNKEDHDAEHLQRTGIVAGLAVLGSGCPTCGTTLLGPLLASMVGSGSLALAGAIAGSLTVLAVLLGLFSLKHLGYEVYVIMVEEKYRRKHGRQSN